MSYIEYKRNKIATDYGLHAANMYYNKEFVADFVLTDTAFAGQLLNEVPGGIVIYAMSDKLDFIVANNGYYKLFGFDKQLHRKALTSEELSVIYNVYHEDKAPLEKNIKDAITDFVSFNQVVRIKNAKGKYQWTHVSARPYREASTGKILLFTMLVDITREKEYEYELERRAEYDRLTGIPNKDAFYRRTAEMLEYNPLTEYVLLRLNVDNFKVVNDVFGRKKGDELLKALARTCYKAMPDFGTYGRLEPDHFVMCFPREEFDPDAVYDKINGLIKNCGFDFEVKLSMGIYEIDDATVPIDQICDRAALAVNSISGEYNKKYAYYDAMFRRQLLNDHNLIADMEKALENRELFINIQPVFSLTSNKPISGEVLVRWQQADGNIVFPDEFMPTIEKNGFISRLDHYVWEEACAYLKKCKECGREILPLSMNVSRYSLYEQNFCDTLLSLVQKYDIDPAFIKLEITESSYMKASSYVVNIITKLQSYGFKIYMDDFGSGYSSLNMLLDLPVDVLKIDKAFMDNIESSERARNLISSIISMAKGLNIEVIAEGIETVRQVEFMRQIGCDSIQGFYFSRPLPIEEFSDYSTAVN